MKVGHLQSYILRIKIKFEFMCFELRRHPKSSQNPLGFFGEVTFLTKRYGTAAFFDKKGALSPSLIKDYFYLHKLLKDGGKMGEKVRDLANNNNLLYYQHPG